MSCIFSSFFLFSFYSCLKVLNLVCTRPTNDETVFLGRVHAKIMRSSTVLLILEINRVESFSLCFSNNYYNNAEMNCVHLRFYCVVAENSCKK